MAVTITRVEARRIGETGFIQDGGANRSFISNDLTLGDDYSSANVVDFDSVNSDISPIDDLAEIRFIGPLAPGSNEEVVYSFYNADFSIDPFNGIFVPQPGASRAGFELRSALGRASETIVVSMSPTTDNIYLRNGRPPPGRTDGLPPSSSTSARRPEPVRVGDPGTVHGVLPYEWTINDTYASDFSGSERIILTENLGRPLRYNTYMSVDETNRLLLRNPRYDPTVWPQARRISENRYEREPEEILARKSAILVYSTLFMDVSHGWVGTRSTWHQSLEWPRFDVYDRSNYFYSPESIPDKIKQAYADFAFELAREDRLLETIEPGTTNFSAIQAGNVSLSLNSRDRKAIIPKYIEIQIEEFATRFLASSPASFDIPY